MSDPLDDIIASLKIAPDPVAPASEGLTGDIFADVMHALGLDTISAKVPREEAAQTVATMRALAPRKPEKPVEKDWRDYDLQAELAAQAAQDPERMGWPVSWFDQTDSSEVVAMQTLWASLLREVLSDIAATCALAGKSDANAREAAAAMRWIGSADFNMVCSFTALDPVSSAERLRDQLATPEGAAAFILNLRGNSRRKTGGDDDGEV